MSNAHAHLEMLLFNYLVLFNWLFKEEDSNICKPYWITTSMKQNAYILERKKKNINQWRFKIGYSTKILLLNK